MICEKLLYMPAYVQTVLFNIMPMQLKAMTNQGDNYVPIIFVFWGIWKQSPLFVMLLR